MELSQRKYEVTFHEMKSIEFSQLSPSKRYVACSEGDTVIVWDLLRKEKVGVCKMDFRVSRFDFDENETKIYIYGSSYLEIFFFLLDEEGMRKRGVVKFPGYADILLRSIRTGHLVLSKKSDERALIDLSTFRELRTFPCEYDSFSMDAEGNALFFKPAKKTQIGFLDLSTLAIKLFEDFFWPNLVVFLGRSRRELDSCASQKWPFLMRRRGVGFDVSGSRKLCLSTAASSSGAAVSFLSQLILQSLLPPSVIIQSSKSR